MIRVYRVYPRTVLKIAAIVIAVVLIIVLSAYLNIQAEKRRHLRELPDTSDPAWVDEDHNEQATVILNGAETDFEGVVFYRHSEDMAEISFIKFMGLLGFRCERINEDRFVLWIDNERFNIILSKGALYREGEDDNVWVQRPGLAPVVQVTHGIYDLYPEAGVIEATLRSLGVNISIDVDYQNKLIIVEYHGSLFNGQKTKPRLMQLYQ